MKRTEETVGFGLGRRSFSGALGGRNRRNGERMDGRGSPKARSVDSPFDEFHGEVKKGERTCTEEGEENVLGHLGCVFVCLFEILETCICL